MSSVLMFVPVLVNVFVGVAVVAFRATIIARPRARAWSDWHWQG
jgi:hypothetical protein